MPRAVNPRSHESIPNCSGFHTLAEWRFINEPIAGDGKDAQTLPLQVRLPAEDHGDGRGLFWLDLTLLHGQQKPLAIAGHIQAVGRLNRE
jgi:hypothetical protein